MACEKYEELLQAFFDQSLDKSEQKDLKQHLDQCSDCRFDFMLYKSVFDTLDDLPDKEAPNVSGGVLEVVENEPIQTPSAIMRVVQPQLPRRNKHWAVGLAAIALFAIGMFWGSPQDSDPLPKPLLTAALDTTHSQHALNAKELGKDGDLAGKDRVKLVIDGSTVDLLRNGSKSWQRVDKDLHLGFGDRIRTGDGSKALLFYRDSGRLKILPQSDVQVLALGVRIKQGGTWIKIFKKGTNFAAETPNAVASVRGTVYTVEYDEEALSTRVNLFSSHNPTGGVVVETEMESSVLKEGTCVDVVLDDIEDPRSIPLETYLAFNHLPPEEVVLSEGRGEDHSSQGSVGSTDDTGSYPIDSSSSDGDQSDIQANDLPKTNDDEFFEGVRKR